MQASNALLPVRDQSDVGSARREITALVAGCGRPIPEEAVAGTQLAVTELGTNIVRHAGGDGYLLVRPIFVRSNGAAPGVGIEVVAVDRGPGIAGSTGASGTAGGAPAGLGVGLPSVERLASDFDVYSVRAAGTVVLARFWFGQPPPASRPVDVGGVSLPVIAGEKNGDGWAVAGGDSWAALVLVDGLGHGPHAHEAAVAGLASFPGPVCEGDLRGWITQTHAAMRATRGAVAAIVRVDIRAGALEFAGVGNVAGRVMAGETAHGLLSPPGILGGDERPPRPGVVVLAWAPGACVVLWSDGIKPPADWDRYDTLLSHDPAVIAAALHRDCARSRDDATIVVLRDRSEPQP